MPFTLVIDDFGVKQVGKYHTGKLIQALKSEGFDLKPDRKRHFLMLALLLTEIMLQEHCV